MAKSYLYLAENIGDDAIDDVEKTYMTHATYVSVEYFCKTTSAH